MRERRKTTLTVGAEQLQEVRLDKARGQVFAVYVAARSANAVVGGLSYLHHQPFAAGNPSAAETRDRGLSLLSRAELDKAEAFALTSG